MNLETAADEIAAELDTVDGLRVSAYPPDKVSPPFAVVGLPTIDYGQTYQEGTDRVTLPVLVGVGRQDARTARGLLHKYRQQAKAAIEAGTYESFDDFKVTTAEPEIVSFADVEYLAYRLSVDIAGTGAS